MSAPIQASKAPDQVLSTVRKNTAGVFADQLRRIVEVHGGATAVSKVTGIPLRTIQNYIRKSDPVEPKVSDFHLIVTKLREYVEIGSRGDWEPEVDSKRPGLLQSIEQQFAFVKRLDVRPSAGPGSVVSEEGPADVLAFRRDWLTSIGVNPDRAHVLEVRGDSMEPTIRDGDMLLVDTSIDHVRDNGIYVVSHNGYVLVKRVQIALDGTVTLISDNAHYEVERVAPGDVENLQVAGRVMWFGRSI